MNDISERLRAAKADKANDLKRDAWIKFIESGYSSDPFVFNNDSLPECLFGVKYAKEYEWHYLHFFLVFKADWMGLDSALEISRTEEGRAKLRKMVKNG